VEFISVREIPVANFVKRKGILFCNQLLFGVCPPLVFTVKFNKKPRFGGQDRSTKLASFTFVLNTENGKIPGSEKLRK
jgi:hypothetical protein